MKRRTDVASLGLNSFLVLVAIFMVAPLVFVIVNSFNSAAFSTFPPEGFSLRWYESALTNQQFQKGFRNSLLVATLATTLTLVLGTLASRALVSHRFPGREAVRGFFLSPLIVPRIVLSCALFLAFVRVRLSGTLIGMTLGHTLIGLPYVVTLVTASMLNVNPETEEAAAETRPTSCPSVSRRSGSQNRAGGWAISGDARTRTGGLLRRSTARSTTCAGSPAKRWHATWGSAWTS